MSRNISAIIAKANIFKRAVSHIFRHSYVVHMLQNGTDIITIQELLGRQSVETAMVYADVLREISKKDIKSPLGF